MPLVTHIGEFYSLLCALFWATAVIFFRKAGEQAPPVALNLFKGATALVLLVPTMMLVDTAPWTTGHTAQDWLVLVGSGVIGIGIADTLFFASLNRLGAGRSAIVNCLYSPLVVVCSAVLLGESVGLALLGGMGLMVCAILLESNPFSASTASQVERREQRTGVALGVASMVMMAVGIVLAKPVLERSDVLWASVVRVAGGTAFAGLLGLHPKHHAAVRRTFTPSRQWRFTLPGAVIGSYLAMVVWLAGMKYTSAGVASVLNQTSALLVPLLAALFLGEALTRRKLSAVALGFGGAVLVAMWGRG
jgi:drug/metabolite transporter (DMT)-like permease